MPHVDLGPARIHYTEHRDPTGPPVLLLAPGGMRSAAAWWSRSPWDPRARLDGLRVIAMDQRNAGSSTAPVRPGDGWHSHTEDQVALLDHLGLDEVDVVGMCIGGPYAVRLAHAGRVRRAVVFQPIGLDDNRHAFHAIFTAWATEVGAAQPQVSDETWAAYGHAMFGGDFMFGNSREDVAGLGVPVLLMPGTDLYHPAETSREFAQLAPRVEVFDHWREPARLDALHATILRFLSEPGSVG